MTSYSKMMKASFKKALLLSKDKKGMGYGIEVVLTVALGLFILLLVAVAILAGAYALLGSSIFPTSSQGYNQTSTMINNLTSGLVSFFGSSATFFAILVVVVIMILLGLMIGAVWYFTKFGGGAGIGKA